MLRLLLALAAATAAAASVDVREWMRVRPLTATATEVVIRLSVEEDRPADNFRRFPRLLGQLLERAQLSRLHFSLSGGRWDDDWGDAQFAAAGGAELLARWPASVTESAADGHWKAVTHALAGVFCASLTAMTDRGAAATSQLALPLYSNGTVDAAAAMRYATLPKEAVCTENLTPWLKLWPCRSRGMTAALHSPTLFSAAFHALITSASRSPDGSLRLENRLVAVFPFPRDSIVLQRLLGSQAGLSACPLASSSQLLLDRSAFTAAQRSRHRLTLSADSPLPQPSQDALITYPLRPDSRLRLQLALPDALPQRQPPALRLQQFAVGVGAHYGQLNWRISNAQPTAVNGTLLLTMPWWLRVYIHTLTVHAPAPSPLLSSRMQLREPYGRPTSMELQLLVPANSTLALSLDFDMVFLGVEDFPPDANRGFDVPAALFVTQAGKHVTYSRGVLLLLPTPDFSMPFNVITLSSTAMAFFFGTMFNIFTRPPTSKTKQP